MQGANGASANWSIYTWLRDARALGRVEAYIGEAKGVALEANDVLNVTDLALEENGAVLELIWIILITCLLFEDLTNPSNDNHLVGTKDGLETFGKRWEI